MLAMVKFTVATFTAWHTGTTKPKSFMMGPALTSNVTLRLKAGVQPDDSTTVITTTRTSDHTPAGG